MGVTHPAPMERGGPFRWDAEVVDFIDDAVREKIAAASVGAGLPASPERQP